MTSKRKRPRDISQRAKLIVNIAAGEVDEGEPERTPAQEFARSGGLKGGKARANKLSKEQRREIAQRAANIRWGNIQR